MRYERGMKAFIDDYREHSSTEIHNIIIRKKQGLVKAPEVQDFSLWSNKRELKAVASKKENQ